MTEQIDPTELTALDKAATPGLWLAAPYSTVLGRGIVAAPEGRMIGSIVEHEDAPGNAALIVYLRNHVPAILALAARNAKLEAALRAINRRASPSPDRTLGDCADELGFITDIARAALTEGTADDSHP